MAEIGRVRQNSYENYSEGQDRLARLNRRAELVVVDVWDQFVFDGRAFQMQLGTEDAPINTTTSIDDQLSWWVVDNAVGYALIPAYVEHHVVDFTTATLIHSMIELDRGTARYSSGGTAYVPENLRLDRPRAAVGGSFVVGTDVTVAAKTAVPQSLEIARRVISNDAVATQTGAENSFHIWSAKTAITAVLIDGDSLVGHFGAATADATGYGTVMFVQIPVESMT